jgi:hypothetical protein
MFSKDSRLTGRHYKQRKGQANYNDDTLTDREINEPNFDAEKSNLQSENKMEI